MDEGFSQKDKLDYPSIIFREIDRICFLSVNVANGDPLKSKWVREMNEENIKNSLNYLEALIYWKLSEENRAKYDEEKKDTNRYHNNSLKFSLITKYLALTGLLSGRRMSFETSKSDE